MTEDDRTRQVLEIILFILGNARLFELPVRPCRSGLEGFGDRVPGPERVDQIGGLPSA